MLMNLQKLTNNLLKSTNQFMKINKGKMKKREEKNLFNLIRKSMRML